MDLISKKLYTLADGSWGGCENGKPSAEELEKAGKLRGQMLETLCETDDFLMEKFIKEEPISEEEIKTSIRKLTLQLKLTPVLCGSAFKNKGVQPVLDAVIDYLPSPLDIPPVSGKLYDKTIMKKTILKKSP